MKRTYYTNYVNHMLRLYFKTDGEDLRTEIDQLNYNVVKLVIEKKPENIKELIKHIILGEGNIPENINNMEYFMDKELIWDIFRNITNEIATIRGLI